MNKHCPVPLEAPENATPIQKVEAHGERQTYMLCRIQSAEQLLIQLAIDLAKDSVDAGCICREMVRNFKQLEMTYLFDSRNALQKLMQDVDGDKILSDVLAERRQIAEAENRNKELMDAIAPKKND